MPLEDILNNPLIMNDNFGSPADSQGGTPIPGIDPQFILDALQKERIRKQNEAILRQLVPQQGMPQQMPAQQPPRIINSMPQPQPSTDNALPGLQSSTSMPQMQAGKDYGQNLAPFMQAMKPPTPIQYNPGPQMDSSVVQGGGAFSPQPIAGLIDSMPHKSDDNDAIENIILGALTTKKTPPGTPRMKTQDDLYQDKIMDAFGGTPDQIDPQTGKFKATKGQMAKQFLMNFLGGALAGDKYVSPKQRAEADAQKQYEQQLTNAKLLQSMQKTNNLEDETKRKIQKEQIDASLKQQSQVNRQTFANSKGDLTAQEKNAMLLAKYQEDEIKGRNDLDNGAKAQAILNVRRESMNQIDSPMKWAVNQARLESGAGDNYLNDPKFFESLKETAPMAFKLGTKPGAPPQPRESFHIIEQINPATGQPVAVGLTFNPRTGEMGGMPIPGVNGNRAATKDDIKGTALLGKQAEADQSAASSVLNAVDSGKISSFTGMWNGSTFAKAIRDQNGTLTSEDAGLNSELNRERQKYYQSFFGARINKAIFDQDMKIFGSTDTSAHSIITRTFYHNAESAAMAAAARRGWDVSNVPEFQKIFADLAAQRTAATERIAKTNAQAEKLGLPKQPQVTAITPSEIENIIMSRYYRDPNTGELKLKQ